MNGNGIVKFEIEGVNHTLYFGMKAVSIFINKSNEELLRINEEIIRLNSEKSEGEELIPMLPIDETKAVVYAVYGGMCNHAERYELPYPKYVDAYDLTEKILLDKDKSIQADIWETFQNSRASADLFALLNKGKSGDAETSEEKKSL